MAQLKRIGAAMEQRWSLEGEVRKEKSGDDIEGSEDGPGESQEEGTLSSTFYYYSGFVFSLIEFFIFCELNM